MKICCMRISGGIMIGLALLFMGMPTATGREGLGLAELLPAADEIPGWKLDGEPLAYDADNLWEYIDGSAESFLSFDFQRVVAQDYLSVAGEGLKVEVYEHGSPLMAYGIYAQMRSPGLTFHEIGNEAFADEYSMNFWKGRFYVRVAGFETDEGMQKTLSVFANAVAAKIIETGSLPAEAAAFPVEGLVPNDIRYLTQGVLGREKFPRAFMGTYKVGGEEAKLYLAALADSAAARDTFEWYTDELESFQATAEGPDGDYILGLGKDPYQGHIIVFNFRNWIGVLAGLKNPAGPGEEIAKRTVDNLMKIR